MLWRRLSGAGGNVGGAAPAPAVTYVHSGSPTNTSQTFSNVPIGDPASDRLVIVTVGSAGDDNEIPIGVSINGDGAPSRVDTGVSNVFSGVYSLIVSSGSTANISFSNVKVGAASFSFSVIAAYGFAPTPSATDSNQTFGSSFSFDFSGNFTSNDIVVAGYAAQLDDSGGSLNTNNLTVDASFVPLEYATLAGSSIFPTATSFGVSSTPGGFMKFSAAVFEPI